MTSATHATNAQLISPCTRRLQITPAHDAKDFATGKRNKLEFINILNDDGTLNERCGPYAGKPRYEVRQHTILIWILNNCCLRLGLGCTCKFWGTPVPLGRGSVCPAVQVRKTIVEFLEGKGLFRGTRPNPMVLGLCSRSGDVIEPLMRPQWWATAETQLLPSLACCLVSKAPCSLFNRRWLVDDIAPMLSLLQDV